MSATVAATPSHYRCSDNPRTVRKPGGKHVGTLGVGAIPSIPANASFAGVSSTRSFLFGNALSPQTVRRYSDDDRRRRRRRNFCPVMEWQDCTVKMEVEIPASAAYNFYSDRESFPLWMPFISSVKVLEDKPDLSKWSLKYNAFGQDIEYSWIARNMQSIPNQKIHWRSLEGLPNRGAVRFYPKGTSSCLVEVMIGKLGTCRSIMEFQQNPRSAMFMRHIQGDSWVGKSSYYLELTVSYEVPQVLVPVTSALQPVLEGLLRQGLERFATLAKSKSS